MGFANGMLRHPVFAAPPFFGGISRREGLYWEHNRERKWKGLLVSLADFGRYSMLVWVAMGVGLGILGLILLGDNHRKE